MKSVNQATTRHEAGRERATPSRSGSLWVNVLVAMALVGGSLFAYSSFSGGKKATPTNLLVATATRGPFDHIVTEQGEIESSSNIDVICEVKAGGGTGTPIIWVIDEGAYVKRGDKLVELDSSAFEQEMKTQRIAVASAEALVISSEAVVRTAEIALQEYLEGTYLSERKTILSEIAVAEQEMRKAELNLDSARRLAAKGMLKGLQIEAEEFAVSNAKNVLESAQTRLKVLDELTREKNKVQFESDIEAARAKLKSDQSVLAEEMDKLHEIESQISRCVIFSPADGVVVHANEFNRRGGSEFVVEQGATVRERQVIIRLPDPSRMQVKANINESRITLVQPGMPVKVRVNAVPDEMLAQVKRVNKYAEPGSWFNSSVKEYATYIEIMNPPEGIRTGMTAEVRIFVNQLSDVVQIPVHGVYEYRGHHFCLLQKSSTEFETKEIEIGATNDKMVTIASGLSEGDAIVLNPRAHMNLMQLPELPVIEDRKSLIELSETPVPADQSTSPERIPREQFSSGGSGRPGGESAGRGREGTGGPGRESATQGPPRERSPNRDGASRDGNSSGRPQ